MKFFCLVLLSSSIVFFSSQAVQGRLLFLHDSSITSEGSNTTFICQDTERLSALKTTWSFHNTCDIVLFENGSLARGISGEKYKVVISGTKLNIINLAVNDSGDYTCVIRGENGEILFSATAALKVISSLRDEQATNTSRIFVSLTRPFVSSVNHNLRPSPTATLVLSPTMQKTVFHNTASVSTKRNISVTVNTDEATPCGNSTDTDIAFIDERTSPNLLTANEGGPLKLQCSYCVVSSPEKAVLSWYKQGVEISNDTRHVIHKNELGVPVVEQSRDEGLYKCVVTFTKRNISRFITVIVKKAEPNPLLSSVLAQNKSYLSVKVTWRLTDHGLFTSAIVSLDLRLLNSSDWSHVVSNISQDHGIHTFEHLQPGSEYLLNITLYNKYRQTESRALVFWSAATNSSDADTRTLFLYQVTNRRALGVALGIIGLLVFAMIIYACVTWCQDDKRGYAVPPDQRIKSETDENDSLFSFNSSTYYNKAFEDDKDWLADEEIAS